MMRLYFSIFPVLIFFLTCVQGKEPLTLQRAIELGVKENPSLEVSRQRVIAADGRRINLGKWENPIFKTTLQEASFDRGIDQGLTQAGLLQEFPFPGKKRLDRQIGKTGVKISGFNLLSAQLTLIRDIKIAYYGVLVTERRHTIAKEILDLAKNSSDLVAKRFEAGRGSVQEQLRAEIETERSIAAVVDIHQQSIAARQRLAALVGDAAIASVPISGNLTAFIASPLEGLQNELGDVTQHPRMAVARAVIEQANLKLKREQLERIPNLKVGFQAGRDWSINENVFGLKFTLPLPLINRRKGIIKAAGANVKMAQSELSALQLALTTRLRTSAQRYVAASRQVATYRDRILPKSDEAVKLTDKGYSEGKFSLTDLLDTQRTTASVHLIYQDKLFELLRAQAEIEALIDSANHSKTNHVKSNPIKK